jgi:hypothetical protein
MNTNEQTVNLELTKPEAKALFSLLNTCLEEVDGNGDDVNTALYMLQTSLSQEGQQIGNELEVTRCYIALMTQIGKNQSNLDGLMLKLDKVRQ